MRRYTLSFLTRFKSKKRICENKILSRIMSGCENILRADFVFATVLIATTKRGEAGIKKYLKTE